MDIDQENVIKILGIENLPDDRKLAILAKMTDLVQKRLLARMLESLPENQQEKFGKILEQNHPQEIQKFVEVNLPNFQQWLVEEVTALKKELSELSTVD